MRELWCAGGGPWCSSCRRSRRERSLGRPRQVDPPRASRPRRAPPAPSRRREAARRDRAVASQTARRGRWTRSPRPPARRGSPASPRCTGRGARSGRGRRCRRRAARTAPRATVAPHPDGLVSSGSDCGQTSRKLAGPSAARVRIRLSRGWPSTVSLATTRTLADPVSRATSAITCSTGLSPATLRISSRRLRRNQPDFASGCVETISSSTCSSASMSRTASSGPPSNTTPWAGMPVVAQRLDDAVEPAPGSGAACVVVDDVAGRGLVHRRHHDGPDRPLLGAVAHGLDQLAAGQRLVGHDQDDAQLARLAGVAHTCASCSAPVPLFITACFAPGHAVLVRAADDRRYLVEVEHRRWRRHLPLECQRAPRVGPGQRAAGPAHDHVVEEDEHRRADRERRRSR